MVDVGTMPVPLAVGVALGLVVASIERAFGVLGAIMVGLHAVLALTLLALIGARGGAASSARRGAPGAPGDTRTRTLQREPGPGARRT